MKKSIQKLIAKSADMWKDTETINEYGKRRGVMGNENIVVNKYYQILKHHLTLTDFILK